MTETRFAAGTFAPNPRPAALHRMLLAQTRMETVLLLRNGEQLLLTMLIPIALLIGLSLLPFGDFGTDPKVNAVVPAVLTVAIMSTAFTGQAIATGFDRRYGALKRLGATAMPRWAIVAGKSSAVLVVVILQSVILGLIGLALGWRPDPLGLLLGAVMIIIGTYCFAALGLLLGGTLPAEIVLALANLVWFVLLGIGSIAMLHHKVPGGLLWFAKCVPSGALTTALDKSTQLSCDPFAVAVLLVWGLVATALAIRYFKFH